MLTPYTMRVPRKCNERCYINRILPVLLKKRVSFRFLRTFLVTNLLCDILFSMLIGGFIFISDFDCYLLHGKRQILKSVGSILLLNDT